MGKIFCLALHLQTGWLKKDFNVKRSGWGQRFVVGVLIESRSIFDLLFNNKTAWSMGVWLGVNVGCHTGRILFGFFLLLVKDVEEGEIFFSQFQTLHYGAHIQHTYHTHDTCDTPLATLTHTHTPPPHTTSSRKEKNHWTNSPLSIFSPEICSFNS